MGIRNQKVGNVLILVSFRNGLPRRPVGPPRNDRLFRQSQDTLILSLNTVNIKFIAHIVKSIIAAMEKAGLTRNG